MPWYGKSDWVAPTATPEIEEFIEKVRANLFNNPGKKIWVKDNLERSEREALKNFRNWPSTTIDVFKRWNSLQKSRRWFITLPRHGRMSANMYIKP